MSMDHVQYGGTPYLNNYNFGWDNHLSTSSEESHNTFHSPQVQRSSLEETMTELAQARAEMENSRIQMAKSSLEETMVELRGSQAEFAMAKVENERSMAELDYVYKGLPRIFAQNEISPLPQEKMKNSKATMAEWRRCQAEFATSQTQFMEEVNQPPQK